MVVKIEEISMKRKMIFTSIGVLLLAMAALATPAFAQDEDTAIEHAEYTLTLANGEDKGKFIVVWKKQNDNSWKWHLDIFNSDLP
jgi:ketosteroid isomerase-like protein